MSSSIHHSRCLTDKQRKTLLPLLNILEKVDPTDRIILLTHLDDCSRESIIAMISIVIRNNKSHAIEKEMLRQELGPVKKHIRYLVNPRFKKKNKEHLIAIGGSPFDTILKTGIPLLLHLFR
jgi:hypothetical protein